MIQFVIKNFFLNLIILSMMVHVFLTNTHDFYGNQFYYMSIIFLFQINFCIIHLINILNYKLF